MDLSLIRDLRTDPERPFHLGAAVAEGAKTVSMMLRATLPSFVVGTAEEIARLALPPSIPTHVYERTELEAHIGFRPHSPVFAVATLPGRVEATVHANGPRLFLNSIVDNANVGAIVRTAVALGFRDIIVDAPTSSPFMRRAIRTSMGMVFHASISYVTDASGFMEGCTAAGKRLCMIEQTPFAVSLDSVTDVPDLIVIGAEGTGISQALLEQSSLHCAIPMSMNDCSLNVAAATAIVLSHMATLRSI